MLRASVFQAEYGFIGGGAVNASLVGSLLNGNRRLGPVAAVSYRLASRIANGLRAGRPARTADELDAVRLIFFHSPPDQSDGLISILKAAKINWHGKSIVFCECEVGESAANYFRDLGATIAIVRRCAVPGRVILEGTAPALTFAHRMAREIGLKPIEILSGAGSLFGAAVTLGSGALTPLIDRAAAMLRECGIRDTEAVKLAAALFEQTVREYAHSGKQSWSWHIQEPCAERLEAEIAAAGDGLKLIFRELLLLGFEGFEKHPATSRALRSVKASE